MESAISTQILSDLVASIYDCSLDPGLWRKTLKKIYLELDFANAAMTLLDAVTGEIPFCMVVGPEPKWIERIPHYGSDVIELWGGTESLRSQSWHEPKIQSCVTDRSSWETNPWYTEWVRPQGLHDALAIVLTRDEAVIGSVGFGRHLSKGDIGELELEACRLLAPHLQRAVAISRLLDLKNALIASFDATLDSLSIAVVLVGEDLRVVFLNSAGRDLIAAGSAIFCRRGYLRVRPAAVEAALAVAVRGAADDEAAIGRRGFGIRATSAGTPHILHVLPLRRGGIRPRLIPGAAAAILIAPTVQKAPCQANVLAALYNLTPAEARVFVEVAAGMTRAEAAGVLGVGPNTVKAHLAEIFAKTGTRRQADLVALAAAITLPLRQ